MRAAQQMPRRTLRPGSRVFTTRRTATTGSCHGHTARRQTGTFRRRLRACLLAVLLLGAEVSPPALAPLIAVSLAATDAQARSSGGYSRPGSQGSRTPSFGSMGAAPRTPSVSGGYSRPGTSWSSPTRRPSVTSSAGDRAFSRERSAEALGDVPRRLEPSPVHRPWAGWGWGHRKRHVHRGHRARAGSGWYPPGGWTAPDYARMAPSRFGAWDGLFLWFLLSNLSRPGSGDFFYNHQNDPGYRQWRAEADRLARDDADLRQKLAQLDRQVADKQGRPRDPGYLPPDVPPGPPSAAADRTHPAHRRIPAQRLRPVLGDPARRRGPGVPGLATHPLRPARRPPPSPTASTPMASRPTRLQSLGAMLRHKVSNETYAAQHFRVGMTLTCDPTPFVLTAGVTKVPMPDTGGANLLVSVQAVGRVVDGAAELVRLYLPDQRSMFQLHLDRAGNPDECRYFGLIDQVTPADAAEWGAWLDPAEGMIGWSEFQTKDGRIYARAWAPGTARIPPRMLTETIETADGRHGRTSQAMLYAAQTGLSPPAPDTEYILVAAIDAGQQAWVEIWAGIDINPAALSLA